jgi:hypothetical protein
MAGYSGTKVLSALPGVGGMLSGYNAPSNMYLQEGGDTDVYSSNYTLNGYEVPGL